MNANLKTVQGIYESFGRGDVPEILDKLASDVRWEDWADHSGQNAGVPYLARRVGREGVKGFFGAVAQTLKFNEFRILEVYGEGRHVVAEIALDAENVTTGRRLRDEELHLWTFNERGEVIRFRHYIDTAKHIGAAGLKVPE
jgi:ketosteroid isomerase-like protein